MDDARFRDELRRYWDEITRGETAAAPGNLEPELAATIRRLHAVDDVPPPDSGYANKVRGQIIGARAVPLALPATLPTSPNGHAAPQPGWSHAVMPDAGQAVRRWTPGQMAIAALLVLVVGVGFIGFWQRSRPHVITIQAPVIVAQFELLWQSTGGPEVLVQPQGLAVDPQGNLWVVDAGNDRFQIFAPDGTFLETWGSAGSTEGQFDFAMGQKGEGGDIAFDVEGNFYVADSGNHRIQKFAPDRTFLLAWGSEGERDGQFLTARTVAASPDGSVYVCDEVRRDVQKFDAEGRYLLTLASYELEEGKPSTADSVAVDGRGFVWVADQTNYRIARFSPDGTFLDAWGVRGTHPGELFRPADLTVDREGLIYVADRSIKRIQLFAPDGSFLGEVRADPADPGGFSSPLAVAVGPDGTSYISSDYSVHAFRVFLFPGAGPMS